MAKFEKVWFEQNSSCLGLNSSHSSDSIGVDSFWGLFLIAGVASSAALIICMVTFLYENRDALVQLDPPTPVWRKIKALATRFDNKDLSSILSEKVKWEREVASMAWMQPASEYGDPMSPNGQTSPETTFGIELANSNQEPKGVPEVVDVNT
ncbi:Glutamate receptor 2.8 [Vitis vinifera]|uniref:Glutamate receptor 2.8 n=1 Tax=Vitis vinifera TaxID=29760 RepID=A0A438HIF9_VITVI|nr:Glutamate receptor 2.8 [Vitis vinifera]